jgi:APA family basic amino acid/polyamine antiporter
MSMNFTRNLADTFTFMVLLTTLTVLVPFLFSIISFVLIANKQRKLTTGRIIVSVLAFLYSMWAVIGSGQEIVYWGFILLMAGLPFYALIIINRKRAQ